MSKALVLLGFLTLMGCNCHCSEDKADYLERVYLNQTLMEKHYTSKYVYALDTKDTLQAEIYKDSASMASYCADVAYDEMERMETTDTMGFKTILGLILGGLIGGIIGLGLRIEKLFIKD